MYSLYLYSIIDAHTHTHTLIFSPMHTYLACEFAISINTSLLPVSLSPSFCLFLVVCLRASMRPPLSINLCKHV